MSNEQQLGQSFGAAVVGAVIGNVKPGHAAEQSGTAADAFLGLGADPYSKAGQSVGPAQLDGCALNAK